MKLVLSGCNSGLLIPWADGRWLVYNVEELKTVVSRGLQASMVGQVLVEESILGWDELELEIVRDAQVR